MSREEALDWVARNVHEWPRTSIAYVYSDHVFDRSEWQGRRAELQGKPSWGDAPEWAESLGQDKNGQWHWLPHYNPEDRDHEEWMMNTTSLESYKFAGRGLVLGDWCDTLERRPDNKQSEKRGEAHDEVNNPKHYDLFPDCQSIDVIRAALTDEEWRGFLKGNVIKYRLRAGEKGPAEKCLAKSNWYREKLWNENLD